MVKSLGAKDHSISGKGLDVSDKDNKINISAWPVLGLYLPDGIALYWKGEKSYLLTANEGDARDYDAFKEEKRVKELKNNISLKADHYKGFTQSQLDKIMKSTLFNDDQLGRLNVTTTMGKNSAGQYEALYSFGTRSFSVWDLGTVTGNTYLGPFYTDGGEAKEGRIQPYVVKRIGGQRIGFIGLTTESTKKISSPSKETIFNNAVQSAKNAVVLLTQQGIQKIVVISHLGIYEDRELAKAVEGIDFIIGSHTHTKLDHPEVVYSDQNDPTPTLIVQTGANGENLGRVDLTFDADGKLILEGTRGELIPINASLDEDPSIKGILDQYKNELDAYKNTVVGYAPFPLEQAKIRSEETNLGNLIADGMAWKANTLGKKADIAIQNGGGIRAPIDQDLGFIDYQVFLEYLQYLNDNKLSVPGVEGRITKGQAP